MTDSEPSGEQGELERLARDFSQSIGETIAGVVGGKPDDHLVIRFTGRNTVIETREKDGFALNVEGQPILGVRVKFDCVWDGQHEFLAIDKSEFIVNSTVDRQPLFRYDYVKGQTERLPAAHIQIHAHRDSLTHALTQSGKGSVTGKRRRNGKTGAKMESLHLPVGGTRFRPSLEDVLQMLVEEFGVDKLEGWRKHLRDGRARWRTIQTKTVVRDCPEVAVEVLERLGYKVTPPAERPQARKGVLESI